VNARYNCGPRPARGSSDDTVKSLVVSASSWRCSGLTGSTIGASTAPRSRPGPSLETCKTLVRSETSHEQADGRHQRPCARPVVPAEQPRETKGLTIGHLPDRLGGSATSRGRLRGSPSPFELATNAGSKPVRLRHQHEITYAHSLTNLVSLSAGYFNVNESLVALKTNRIGEAAHAPRAAQLRLGALTGCRGSASSLRG